MKRYTATLFSGVKNRIHFSMASLAEGVDASLALDNQKSSIDSNLKTSLGSLAVYSFECCHSCCVQILLRTEGRHMEKC